MEQALIATAIILFVLGFFIFWAAYVVNIMKIFSMEWEGSELKACARLLGIFVPVIGFIMGFISV